MLIFIISLSLFSKITEAQSIKGKIIDATNSDPLIGAVIKIQGTTLGTLSDLDGNYEITDLKPGKYNLEFSYIGYNPKTLNDVLVTANKTTNLDVALAGEGILTEEITVEASPTLANEQSLLTEQKNSSKIQDGISEQQIKRAPDATASEVLKRVIGVNIVDNKFVYVRGTSERYNNTTLNGVLLPSTESDKKSFSFDLFPSKFLENIIIAKSFTPDLIGNFSGGLVQLNTKDFVDQFTFGFESTGSFLTGSTSKGNFYTYNAGQSRMLFYNSGLDNGGRSIPASFPSGKFSAPNVYGQSLINNWGQLEKKSPVNGGYQLTLGNNFSVFKNPLGILLSYTYKNGFVSENVTRSEYNSDTTTLVNYNGRISNYLVLNGGILNLNYKIGNNNKLNFKSTYSIASEDQTQYYEGISRISDYFDRQLYGTEFTERILSSYQVGGGHYIDKMSKLNLTWAASYSEAERNEPDTKTTFYQREEGTDGPFFVPLTTVANENVGQRFYSKLFDINKTFGVNFEQQFFKIGKQRSKIKYGALAVATNRNFTARNFSPILSVFSNIVYLPIDSVFAPQNFDSTTMYMVETTDLSDAYTASEDTYAGYLMFDLPINKLRIIAGLRFEYDEQKVDGYEEASTIPVNVKQKNNDYLPSLNITYALNEKTNIRASATQTVSRPELREIAPFAYVDFVTGGDLSGNPELEESLIQNYDLRYELFPAAGEIAALSLFYKHFDQPIERVIVPTLTGPIPSYTFANATNGAIDYGVELEIRKKLGFISKVLNDVTFNGNVTLVNSKVNLENLQSSVNENERRLQGQSPYTINLGLYYDNYDFGLSANLLYNQFGEKISEVGRFGFNDVYEQGRDVLDFSISKTFLQNFEGKFTIKDILDQDVVFTQNFTLNDNEEVEKIVRRETTGTNFAFTLSYKF
ncbi:MAG: outer membrane beta-barrel protein [Bacteroidota bacterium]|nr:outer membrane beta-barrel protein [Bacteroidota bacterium]